MLSRISESKNILDLIGLCGMRKKIENATPVSRAFQNHVKNASIDHMERTRQDTPKVCYMEIWIISVMKKGAVTSNAHF